MRITRDEVPGCCRGCEHYKGNACGLLVDPTDKHRKAILKAPCRPWDYALRWLGWTQNPEDLAQEVMEGWMVASRETVLEKLGERPLDARRWRWIIEQWLGKNARRRADRVAKREIAVEVLPEGEGSAGDGAGREADPQYALALNQLASVSPVDVAILAVLGSAACWEAAGPGSQATRTRRIALAVWRFEVIYQDVEGSWWPAREAAWIALEERWFHPGRVSPKTAFERTVVRLPGVVDSFTAWRKELYVPGAERSLDLLRGHLPVKRRGYEKTWRDLLGLPIDSGKESGPPGPTPPAPPASTSQMETNVDSKTMMAFLHGELDAAEVGRVLRALARPEAGTDRMALAEMAYAIDAANQLHTERSHGWAHVSDQALVSDKKEQPQSLMAIFQGLVQHLMRRGQSQPDAEDFAAKGILYLVETFGSEQPTRDMLDNPLKDPFAYMFRLALDRGHNRRTSRKFLSHGEEHDPSDDGALAEQLELAEFVRRALDGLSDEHRTILVLADIEGLSYREIAGTLGCPEAAISSRLRRAREALREAFRALNLLPHDERS